MTVVVVVTGMVTVMVIVMADVVVVSEVDSEAVVLWSAMNVVREDILPGIAVIDVVQAVMI